MRGMSETLPADEVTKKWQGTKKAPPERGRFRHIRRGRRESNPRNQFGRLRLYH
jgi:hypothetical protein